MIGKSARRLVKAFLGVLAATTMVGALGASGCGGTSSNSCTSDSQCTSKYGDNAYCSDDQCYYFGDSDPIDD